MPFVVRLGVKVRMTSFPARPLRSGFYVEVIRRVAADGILYGVFPVCKIAGFLKMLEYWQRDKFWDLVSRFLILCLEMLETSAMGLGQDLVRDRFSAYMTCMVGTESAIGSRLIRLVWFEMAKSPRTIFKPPGSADKKFWVSFIALLSLCRMYESHLYEMAKCFAMLQGISLSPADQGVAENLFPERGILLYRALCGVGLPRFLLCLFEDVPYSYRSSVTSFPYMPHFTRSELDMRGDRFTIFGEFRSVCKIWTNMSVCPLRIARILTFHALLSFPGRVLAAANIAVGVKNGYDEVNVQIPEEEKHKSLRRIITQRPNTRSARSLLSDRVRAKAQSLRSDQTPIPLGRYVVTELEPIRSDRARTKVRSVRSDRALPKRRYDISPCIFVYPSMLSPEYRSEPISHSPPFLSYQSNFTVKTAKSSFFIERSRNKRFESKDGPKGSKT
uniref:Uncharacterized protein n=1 Tax=Brassica oleracea var. oleracea TaxID=109376 RepID=A0A0D3DKL3_BRAOL